MTPEQTQLLTEIRDGLNQLMADTSGTPAPVRIKMIAQIAAVRTKVQLLLDGVQQP